MRGPSVIQIKAGKLIMYPGGEAKAASMCLHLAQVKRMQIARFLCNHWGKYIRP
jgi:hypothetical protein